MRLPSRSACLLIGVNTVSLCIGFWFLCQIVVSSSEHHATEEAWGKLTSDSVKLADFVDSLKSTDLASSGEPRVQLQSLSGELRDAGHKGVLMVDADGFVVNSFTSAAADEFIAGSRVAWKADPRASAPVGTEFGWITTPLGSRVAVSHPVAGTGTHLVVYDSEPPNPVWRKSLLALLPLAAGVAFLWTWVLTSVSTYLLSARLQSQESNQKAQSEHDALRNAQDLLRTRDAVIFGLAKLAESRDPETGHHLERISLYSTRLATALRSLPKYQRVVTPSFIRLLGISSVLHDIGKVGLEDTVLLKPGRLTFEERKKMQQHTLVAGACLREIEQRLGASNFLQTAREIALYHHERWDGNGYPVGLAGEAIPLAARIVTVVDVYDALSSRRVYKDAYPHAECVRMIREGAGTQFDPALVDVFLTIESEFAAIAQRFASNQAAADNAARAAANQAASREAAAGQAAASREATGTHTAVKPHATAARSSTDLMTSDQESVLLETVNVPRSYSETSELASSVA